MIESSQFPARPCCRSARDGGIHSTVGAPIDQTEAAGRRQEDSGAPRLELEHADGGEVGIDVHLMIDPVDALIPSFVDAGASVISFHPETSADIGQALGTIRQAGVMAGLVFNPDVPVAGLGEWIGELDLVLLMSVYPGFGGQKFIESVLPKIGEARALMDAAGSDARLEVDGGLTIANVGAVAGAGADTFVAGSTIFGSTDYKATIDAMRQEIMRAR